MASIRGSIHAQTIFSHFKSFWLLVWFLCTLVAEISFFLRKTNRRFRKPPMVECPILRIIKWRIHVFWFIQTLIFYNIIILVAECMPYFGIHLMLVNKFLRYHSNLFFNFFNWCTLILHLLDNIRYFIDLILHKKFGNSISCGHCGEWLIIKTFVDHWIALPGSLTVFYLFNSRYNILAKV